MSPNASRIVSRSASAWHGWWQRREHVHDRHRRVLGQLGERLLRAGPEPDRRDVARENERGVADRLPARELELARAEHHRVAAQLDDAGLERRARTGRGVLEDERDGAAAQDVGRVRLGLELERAVEQRGQLARRQLGSGEEVARQAAQCTDAPGRPPVAGRAPLRFEPQANAGW